MSAREKRDSDIIFTIFTEDIGKLEVIGRSIRKGGSKLAMGMSLFSFVEIGFVEGRTCNTLTDAVPIRDFREAKKDLGKLSLLYRVSEITLLLVHGQEKDERIFSLLLSSMEKINELSLSRRELKLFLCFFSFHLLYFLGYRMYTKKCVFCKGRIKGDCYFNPKEGGVACKRCFKRKPSGIYLEDVSSLNSFFKSDVSEILSENPAVFLKVLDNYLSFIPEAKGKRFV